MTNPLTRPLDLPGGATLANRLAKSAMSEGIADVDNHSTARLETLYRRWTRSGAGLLLTGNIQVDPNHLERPLNIVIHDNSGKEQLARLASAGTSAGTHFWTQLSHTGRKVFSNINSAPLAPSAIALDMGPTVSFPTPRPMTEDDIGHAINQFASAAKAVRNAGFTGVSLHGASGYLIAQFLSPLSNLRTDRWGGSLENRSRFLVEVIGAIRAAVGPGFPISVKLNPFEYQKGGFTSADSVELTKILNGTSLDLIELAGTYRLTSTPGGEDSDDAVRADAITSEAHILPFAAPIRAVAKMPLMVTGGFRTRAAMVEALEKQEADVLGLGRPFIADPESPERLLTGQIDKLLEPDIAMPANVALSAFAVLRWSSMQIERLANGLDPDPSLTGDAAVAAFFELERRNTSALLEHRIANPMKSVVITGASTGIGWATAKLLLDRGFRVFGSVRKQADADRLKAEFGANFTALKFDVTDEASVMAAAREVRAALNGETLFGLVNNAGVAVAGAVLELAADEFRRQMDVNVIGPIITTQAFGPLLGSDPSLKGPKGRIVMISSGAGKNGNPLMSAYSASKHAIEGLSESLRRELMLFGIDVVIVAPGPVKTPIWSKAEQVDISGYNSSPYFPALQKLRKFIQQVGKNGLPAEKIAEAIAAALTSVSPKVRYQITPDPMQQLMTTVLPKRMIDKIIAKRLGLMRGA